MTVDVLFLARDRREFTEESFRILVENTDWNLVQTLYLYDDQSVDGTREFLEAQTTTVPVPTEFKSGRFNGPLPVLLDCVGRSTADVIAKVDNDALLPSKWLNASLPVIEQDSSLDLLGIGTRDFGFGVCGETVFSSSPAPFVGGIGLFRRTSLIGIVSYVPDAREWVGINQSDMTVAWLYPDMPIILLDWIPWEPWVTYSERYERAGTQRKWGRYSERNDAFFGWWRNHSSGLDEGTT